MMGVAEGQYAAVKNWNEKPLEIKTRLSMKILRKNASTILNVVVVVVVVVSFSEKVFSCRIWPVFSVCT